MQEWNIMAQHIAKHHVDINIEKTLIVFSHVEQPTKIILGRRNEEVSVYSRKESTSLELNPLLWWFANSYKYPHLSTVSIFIFVPSERVFSTAGDIRPIQVDLLIFKKKNIHGWFFDRCSSILVFNFIKTFSYYLLDLLNNSILAKSVC